MNTELIRCFIAINLPLDIRTQIDSHIQNLARFTKMVRWVKINSLHLTLKFLGEVEFNRIEKIKSTLTQSHKIGSSFDLRVVDSGCFPGRKRPRVFWLGLDQNSIPHLTNIHVWLEDSLSPLGFEREKRKFSPHLTIGRVKGDESFSDLYSYSDSNPFRSNSFKVDNIFLIRSVLKPGGAEYSVLGTYPL